MSFETAMKRLDEISVQMEQPDITLDNSMKCYKEAVELIAFCRKYIDEAKLTVQNTGLFMMRRHTALRQAENA